MLLTPAFPLKRFYVCNYGPGPRNWYIKRYDIERWIAEDSSGRYRWFASQEAALRAAQKLEQANKEKPACS